MDFVGTLLKPELLHRADHYIASNQAETIDLPVPSAITNRYWTIINPCTSLIADCRVLIGDV